MLGEHPDLVPVDLGETAADREERGHGSLGDTQLAVLDLGEQRDVAGEDADLALDRRDDDGVDGVGIHLGFRSDDFEGERHF